MAIRKNKIIKKERGIYNEKIFKLYKQKDL